MVYPTRIARVMGVVSAAAIVGLTAAACNSDSANSVTSVASTLAANSGVNAQTGTVGQPLSVPISVHVADQNGAALSGVAVTWTVVGSGGAVDSATSTTSATGDAVTDWTLGQTAGMDSLKASTATGLSTVLTATANAGAFASMAKVSGDSQAVASGSAGQPLVVKTVDQFGNAVAGVTVSWAVTGGGALSAASTTSDANGLAQVTLTTGSTPGPYAITASAGSAAPIVFTQTGT